MCKLNKYKRVFIYATFSIVIMWIFFPYVQVWNLSSKYGEYFEEKYKEISFYEDLPYTKPRVVRFENEKARIYTDAGSLKLAINDEKKNVAVVYYGVNLYIKFYYIDGEWVIDGWDAIFTGPTDCQVWPLFLN